MRDFGKKSRIIAGDYAGFRENSRIIAGDYAGEVADLAPALGCPEAGLRVGLARGRFWPPLPKTEPGAETVVPKKDALFFQISGGKCGRFRRFLPEPKSRIIFGDYAGKVAKSWTTSPLKSLGKRWFFCAPFGGPAVPGSEGAAVRRSEPMRPRL